MFPRQVPGNIYHTAPKVRVSVVIPTLNEAENLPLVLPYLPLDETAEVILVDGLSSDHTVEVAQILLPSVKVVRELRRGKGIALRRGFQEATGDIIIVMDADGSNDPREIPRFIRALLEGADFVKGSRFAAQGGTTDMPFYRKLGNSFFVDLVNMLFGGTFTDLCYGYHAFWRYCLDLIDLSDIDGFEIDTAIYVRALRARLRIIDIPSFEGYRFYGIGKLKTFPDGWRVLKTIINEWLIKMRTPALETYPGFRGVIPISGQLLNHLDGEEALPIAPDQYEATEQNWLEGIKLCMRLLNILSQGLCSNNADLQTSFYQIMQVALEKLGAASGSIVLLDDDDHLYSGYLISHKTNKPIPHDGLKEIMENGLAGWVFKNQQPAHVAITREDPRWVKRVWDERAGAIRSALSFPVFSDKRVIGVITLVGENHLKVTDEDLATLMKEVDFSTVKREV